MNDLDVLVTIQHLYVRLEVRNFSVHKVHRMGHTAGVFSC